ncbi:MAG: hypothetical protein WA705_05840 [Candidatus Ozemobacteraceae bacterium]
MNEEFAYSYFPRILGYESLISVCLNQNDLGQAWSGRWTYANHDLFSVRRNVVSLKVPGKAGDFCLALAREINANDPARGTLRPQKDRFKIGVKKNAPKVGSRMNHRSFAVEKTNIILQNIKKPV